jgi:sporulation protein YlmC with PRC-barrel domain
MLLMRDLLDKQVLDRNGRKIGKVDGIVLSVTANRPPKVSHIEMGGVTIARRLNPFLGALWRGMLEGMDVSQAEQPFRISWQKISARDVQLTADVTYDETPLALWQAWLRNHVIRHIPGG